jgi:glycosyltransferase involved in cell wall biosynthesis
VEPASSGALAEGILSMLNDPERRHSMADAARRRAETEFTLQRMISRYEDLYTDLGGVRPRRSHVI